MYGRVTTGLCGVGGYGEFVGRLWVLLGIFGVKAYLMWMYECLSDHLSLLAGVDAAFGLDDSGAGAQVVAQLQHPPHHRHREVLVPEIES